MLAYGRVMTPAEFFARSAETPPSSLTKEESSRSQATRRSLLFSDHVSCVFWAECRVDAVTVADVKSAADQVINDQDHALAAVG